MKRKSTLPNARRRWQMVFLTMLIAAGCLLTSAANCAEENDTSAKIENTREALKQWVETRQLISQEKREMTLKREMLDARIDVVLREIASLQEKIKGAEESIAEADKKRAEMIAENEKLKAASASLTDTIERLEDRTKQLIQRLPDPIRDRIKPLSQRLPEEGKENKLSVSERFQNVVGILNEVDKFNRDISVFSEVRTFNDGTSVEVTTLYLGLGQAFYASANGAVAGIGTATETGWVWKENNLAAPQISDAIAILKNEKVATFVQVPVEIQ